jgi:bacillithiol system protein YtxJ
MFGSFFGKKTCEPALPTLDGSSALEDVMRDELVVLFKHSTACPVSWAAHFQVTRFLKAHPGTHVRVIPVIKERPLSQKIAAVTGVRHESPQVIVLSRGEVVGSASHGEITADALAEMLADARRIGISRTTLS